MTIIDEKQKLRRHYTAIRKRISVAEAERLSLLIARNIFLLPRILESELILIYHKMGSEVDTAALAEMIINSGRGVALPYCREDGGMGAGRIANLREDLAAGPFGAMEPVNGLKGNVDVWDIGAAVCPGIAFDKDGGRLGRGGGHYDRLLREIKGKAHIIGCAFDCQISRRPLPREEHDVTMDTVITETRELPS
ncbi:MAG: 5-formyltetrahydrofolate cyclo-ligase [Chitinispirillales bacterium]|nr:5-formyltetrahydrofolate cyclo-ligase [Chitinispirillales bacterium]